MKNFLLEPGGRVVFGGGCVREYLTGFARAYGPNVLLVSGVRSGQENGAYDEVFRSLRSAGKRVVALPGVQPGPDYETVRRGARLAREQRIDLILGVGGGSVIDCCKAISLAAVCRGDLWADFWLRQGVVDFQPLPVGLVPTTLGTGELNGAVVLTNRACGVRRARNYPRCGPRFVLFDPAYTGTLPRAQVVSDGFRILSRALELYLAPPAAEVTDALLEALVGHVVQALEQADRQLLREETRAGLMWAGALVGHDLFQAGKRCGYPCRKAALQLAMEAGRPFTACLAVLQLAAYRAACKEQPGKLARLAVRGWGIFPENRGREDLALAGAEALETLLRTLGLPTTPEELGLAGPEALHRLAEQAVRAG